MRNLRPLRVVSIAAILLAVAASGAADLPDSSGIKAITRPGGEPRTLSFVRPGLIMEMAVDKLDKVTKGQVVAKQDDREELELLKIAEQEATSNTEIEAEKAVLDADKLELEKKMQGGNAMERREAALKVVVDEARIKLAIDKKKVAEFKFQSSKAALEKLRLISPIDGIVEEIYMRVGEATNGQDMKVMRIIQIDNLWVDVPVPLLTARKLNKGDPVKVLFSDGKVRPGMVLMKDAMADSASGTLNVRVEVPNPERLEPGENVRVTFGTPAVAGGSQ